MAGNMRYEAVGFSMTRPRQSVVLAEQRFKDIADARKVCLDALAIEERFQLLLDNFKEFEIEFLSQSAHYLLWDETHEKAMDWRLALDRRLVNLLSSCRLYHDQTSHIVSRCFGNSSHELEQIEQFKRQLYDSSFEYRLLEGLRNYVQHCGLVLSSITFSSRSPSKTYRAVKVSARLNTKQIERKDFKKAVFDELEKAGELDIRLPVRTYVSGLVSIHAHIRKTIEQRLKNARTVYATAVDEFSNLSDPEGGVVWFEEVDCHNNGNIAFFLITTFLSLYDDLFQRNSLVSDISNLFVSNSGHD